MRVERFRHRPLVCLLARRVLREFIRCLQLLYLHRLRTTLCRLRVRLGLKSIYRSLLAGLLRHLLTYLLQLKLRRVSRRVFPFRRQGLCIPMRTTRGRFPSQVPLKRTSLFPTKTTTILRLTTPFFKVVQLLPRVICRLARRTKLVRPSTKRTRSRTRLFRRVRRRTTVWDPTTFTLGRRYLR